jgi:hypothetical protein
LSTINHLNLMTTMTTRSERGIEAENQDNSTERSNPTTSQTEQEDDEVLDVVTPPRDRHICKGKCNDPCPLAETVNEEEEDDDEIDENVDEDDEEDTPKKETKEKREKKVETSGIFTKGTGDTYYTTQKSTGARMKKWSEFKEIKLLRQILYNDAKVPRELDSLLLNVMTELQRDYMPPKFYNEMLHAKAIGFDQFIVEVEQLEADRETLAEEVGIARDEIDNYKAKVADSERQLGVQSKENQSAKKRKTNAGKSSQASTSTAKSASTPAATPQTFAENRRLVKVKPENFGPLLMQDMLLDQAVDTLKSVGSDNFDSKASAFMVMSACRDKFEI